MGTRDPRVDAYIENAPDFARPILARLRKALHAGCPAVVETIKWRAPAFEYQGLLANMAAFKQHCGVAFWKGKLIDGPHGSPENALGRLTSLSDLPADAVLLAWVRQAAALNERGARVPRKPAAKARRVSVPADLRAALAANRKAGGAFEAFSPSHRSEYVEWITGAKQEETRARRVATAVQWIAAGKSRNWKYERRAAPSRGRKPATRRPTAEVSR